MSPEGDIIKEFQQLQFQQEQVWQKFFQTKKFASYLELSSSMQTKKELIPTA